MQGSKHVKKVVASSVEFTVLLPYVQEYVHTLSLAKHFCHIDLYWRYSVAYAWHLTLGLKVSGPQKLLQSPCIDSPLSEFVTGKALNTKHSESEVRK